jgi:hypothetical protein
MGKAKKFKHIPGLSPELNQVRLARYLAWQSRPTKDSLGNMLGGEVKITGRADPDNLRYTLTFIDASRGPLGQADLIYAGEHVLPSEVRCRVYAGGLPDGSRDTDGCRAAMERIYREAEKLFVRARTWRVSYYCGKDLLETRETTDDDMARVKSVAYHSAPPGADMIKLTTPEGRTLIRTAKKHWVRAG